MISKFLKRWLIISIYLYIAMLIDGFNLPFSESLLPIMFNQIYLSLFILSFCVALLMQTWQLLLPFLNNYIGFILSILTAFVIFLYNNATINIHIFLLIILLALELIIYRSYNKPDPKQSTISKSGIWIGLVIVLVVAGALFSHNSYTQVNYYQDAFPTKDEIMHDYDLPYAYRRFEVNYTTGQRADNVYAQYSFQDGIIDHISSSMFVNGYSKTCNGYDFYKNVPNDENYKLIYEDEYLVYESLHEPSYHSDLYHQTIVTIYHNENYSVYSTFTLQYKDVLNIEEATKKINLYHQYFINFD